MSSEKVDHPDHYNQGEYEVIDVLEDWGLVDNFYLANAVKYIARAEHKGSPHDDIDKAIWYLARYLCSQTDDKCWLKVKEDEVGIFVEFNGVRTPLRLKLIAGFDPASDSKDDVMIFHTKDKRAWNTKCPADRAIEKLEAEREISHEDLHRPLDYSAKKQAKEIIEQLQNASEDITQIIRRLRNE